jgi:hypothetical protein
MNCKSILIILCSIIIVSISYYIITVKYPIPKTMLFPLDLHHTPILYKKTTLTSVIQMRPRSHRDLSYISSPLYHYNIPHYIDNNE